MEFRARRHRDFPDTRVDRERLQSADLRRPCAAIVRESFCRRDGARQPESESRSSASECSTWAHPTAPDTKAGAPFLNSDSEILHRAENCVLDQATAQSH